MGGELELFNGITIITLSMSCTKKKFLTVLENNYYKLALLVMLIVFEVDYYYYLYVLTHYAQGKEKYTSFMDGLKKDDRSCFYEPIKKNMENGFFQS